jgi:predicted PurR-regulated permease PerM
MVQREQTLAVRLLRLCWPLPGALTGATLGFHLYFLQPGLNTDSAAPLIFASFWAFCGLVSGLVCTSMAAWLIERGLRSRLSTNPLITTFLTLLLLIGLCCVLHAPLEARLPALFWPSSQKLPARQPSVSGAFQSDVVQYKNQIPSNPPFFKGGGQIQRFAQIG